MFLLACKSCRLPPQEAVDMIAGKHKVFLFFLSLQIHATWEATDTFVMQVCRLKLSMPEPTRKMSDE